MSLIVGIDLGTVGATVSTIKKGALDVILNEASKRKSPALVSFHNGQRYLGEPAAGIEASNAKNTVREMKLFVGKQWSDPEVQKDISRQANRERYRELPNDQIGVEVTYNDANLVLDVRAYLAMQLGGLKRTSERSLKELQGSAASIRDVVLSVPPFYTDQQRRATLDAARIAGLNVLRLINENTAVALDYGMWKNARNVFDEKTVHVMFADVGYSGTWVSVVSFTKGKATVLSCTWDRELGGRDVDAALVEVFAAEFLAKTKLDPRKDVKAMLKLAKAAEKAKQTLTPEGMNKAEVYVEYLMNETDFKTTYTLEQLDQVVKPLTARFDALVKRALSDAQLKSTDISAVEIVGGSSRMRQFKKALATAMDLDASKPPNYGILTTLNADESVSRGCALMCAMLSPQFRIAATLEIKEFVPLPIKVQWEQPAISASNEPQQDGEEPAASGTSLGLLKRTDETPKMRRVTFRRSEPFEVVASYDDPIEEWQLSSKVSRIIGKYKVLGMPANAGAKGSKIAVTFEHDKSGVFSLRSAELMVEEAVTTVEASQENGEKKPEEKQKKKVTKTDLQVQSSTGSMSEDEMDRLFKQEADFSARDKALKDRADKRNELEEFIYSARSHIEDKLAPYATAEEASKLKAKLDEDENWLYTDEGETATFQQLSARLSALHTPYDAISNRLMEIEARQASVDKLSAQVQQYLSVVNSVEEQYAHLTDDDRKKVRLACDDALAWINAQQEAQSKVPLNKDPVLTAAMIDDKTHKLKQECRPVVEKSKPKPAAAATGAEKEKEKEKDAAGEKMDVEEDGAEGEEKKPSKKDENGMDVEEL